VPAHLSPYTYAANALDAILSGRSDFSRGIAILAGITAVGVAVGAAGMRWREGRLLQRHMHTARISPIAMIVRLLDCATARLPDCLIV
jgi:hypothetical protein